MKKTKRIFSLLIIMMIAFSAFTVSCKKTAGEEPKPTVKNKVMIEEPEATETPKPTAKADADDGTKEKLESMYPVLDGIMRAMLMTDGKYKTDDADFTWRATYVAVTQGIPTHDEYEIFDEEQDVLVPAWAIAELSYSMFAKKMEINSFPEGINYVAYSKSLDSFLFSANDFSALSTKVTSFSRSEDGLLQANVTLIDEESGYNVKFIFILDDNQYYLSSNTAYPYCVMNAMMIEETEE